MHYCDSSLRQLEDFQMSASAANSFTLLDRAVAEAKGLVNGTASKTLLSRHKSGTRVLQEVATLSTDAAPVKLATQRSVGAFQLTLR